MLQGVANRDLKLENLLLDRDGSNGRRPLLKICDFGYSKHELNSPATTGVGTPIYMAPEIIYGSNRYNAKVWNNVTSCSELGSGGTNLRTSAWMDVSASCRVTCLEYHIWHAQSLPTAVHAACCSACPPAHACMHARGHIEPHALTITLIAVHLACSKLTSGPWASSCSPSCTGATPSTLLMQSTLVRWSRRSTRSRRMCRCAALPAACCGLMLPWPCGFVLMLLTLPPAPCRHALSTQALHHQH